jgi:uncharacterized membrane protein YedE/YeeE
VKKNNQLFLSIAVLFFIIAFGLKLYHYQIVLLAIWLIGISIGFVLYRSGICFAAMFQDIILFRNFTMARAVLILIIISFIGINSLQIYAYFNGQPIPGKFHSVGVHTAIGGFLFGLGMTLAGGCASGVLQRISEGFLLFWLVLFGMVIGSVLGAYHFSWWVTKLFSHTSVFLPDYFGWVFGGLGSLILLGSLYCLTFILEKRPVFSEKRDEKCQKRS